MTNNKRMDCLVLRIPKPLRSLIISSVDEVVRNEYPYIIKGNVNSHIFC